MEDSAGTRLVDSYDLYWWFSTLPHDSLRRPPFSPYYSSLLTSRLALLLLLLATPVTVIFVRITIQLFGLRLFRSRVEILSPVLFVLIIVALLSTPIIPVDNFIYTLAFFTSYPRRTSYVPLQNTPDLHSYDSAHTHSRCRIQVTLHIVRFSVTFLLPGGTRSRPRIPNFTLARLLLISLRSRWPRKILLSNVIPWTLARCLVLL